MASTSSPGTPSALIRPPTLSSTKSMTRTPGSPFIRPRIARTSSSSSSTFDTNEVRAIPLGEPTADLEVIAPRTEGVQHYLEHHGDEFLILTDEDAPNFKLMAAPVGDPAHGNWREVIPHNTNMVIDPYGVEPFAHHFVIYGREDGLARIWVRDVANGTTMPIEFEEATYVTGAVGGYTGGSNWTFETDKVRIWYSSPVTPDSVYEIDMVTGDRTLLRQWEVIGGYDPSCYITERLWATAPDGTQVPISLVSLRNPPAGLPSPVPDPCVSTATGATASPQIRISRSCASR